MRTLIIILSFFCAALAAPAARAHAFLDHASPLVGSTVPAAPHEVTLSFTQNLEPAFSTVAVTDASGAKVDQGKPAISGNTMHIGLKALGSGTYRVRWHALSVDTHTTEGSFIFHVGASERNPGASGRESGVSDPLVYARAVHFAATLLLAGIIFFTVFVSEPAFRAAETTPRSSRPCGGQFAGWRGRARAFAVITGATWLVLTAAAMSDPPPAQVISTGVLGIVLTQTTFGHEWLIRGVLACGLAVTLAPFLATRTVRRVGLDAAATIMAAAFAGGLAWAGHAAGGLGSEAIIHPAADVLHLIAAAAWVGALVPLVVLLAATGAQPNALDIARAATLRFSIVGMIAVATLLASGIINSWYLVGSVAALLGTYYGKLLLLKLALFLG